MTDPNRSSFYRWYHRHEARLHWALVGLLAGGLFLLFAEDKLALVSGLGMALLSWAFGLLLALIIASELLCPRVPEDVWREACNDKHFGSQVQELEANFEDRARSGQAEDDIDETTAALAQEALNVYRTRYTWQLLRRTGRRLVVLMCIALAFTGVARVLVLTGEDPYGSALTAGNSLIDYLYSVGITAAYGKAGAESDGARLVSVAYVATTISYLLLLVNYVWMHEGRRENLLSEYLTERYLIS